MFQLLGKTLLGFFENVGNITLIYWKSFQSLLKGQVHLRNWLQQMARQGYDSLPIVLITATAVGMVFSVQITREFAKYGAVKVVGGTVAIAMWRELAPVLTAVVVAGRVGSSIAAELGSMQVTEQIEALKTMAISRTNYLVAPRIFALTVVLPLLVVIADLVGVLGAYVIAINNGVNAITFVESIKGMLVPFDIYGGLIKSIWYGALVAGVSCYYGLNTKGGSTGVGHATTRSVVLSLILIFVFNYFLSNFLF